MAVKCPNCGTEKSRVVDSREVDAGIRRRRRCLGCGSRFTTYERQQRRSLFVVKKDGRREEFNRDKMAVGIRKACEKRPLPTGTIDKLVDDIETDLYRRGKAEVQSSLVGDMVSGRLRELDTVAYIRFASVYREYADLAALKQAVDKLIADQTRVPRVPVAQLPLLPQDELEPTVRRRPGRAKKTAASVK
ncbi:MAG TPA: transcriptional regulator NrdR [Dehalococcoidia bacterium]|nr:transcriptional regulator NrdR [Dehalococcoidia bacterium]